MAKNYNIITETNNPLIAAIETSGRLGSAAIAQGGQLLEKAYFSAPVKHSAEVFPTLEKMLEKQKKTPNQIEQVYISIGPGSFTGLRIAATIAKIMSLANQTKTVTIDTLDLIAYNIHAYIAKNHRIPERIAPILDAKRNRFYVAVFKYEDGKYKKILPDCLMAADDFVQQFSNTENPIAIFGEGLVYYEDKFNSPGIEVLSKEYWNPLPQNLHLLGWEKAAKGLFDLPLDIVPAYMQHPDAKIKKT
ncbi:MAG: tRNA (adenosine(37)-N6)-threonylcarbamoyltransferase complex dimerization subunit type 1 TsaB [Planctomycetes bacterium]|nr:tRNA (adenosine(37)-N6)-threonylcarbamoyltransferase complex dimerization subunit type 1 TsaB [Planctomycetota bacterium]MBL7106737.1 tRNA (adenosine(37)-N6)-threonylcarbamoyltransferase complex dimerization subunit type 1 TsaB [Phycisphaerae bacterium]